MSLLLTHHVAWALASLGCWVKCCPRGARGAFERTHGGTRPSTCPDLGSPTVPRHQGPCGVQQHRWPRTPAESATATAKKCR